VALAVVLAMAFISGFAPGLAAAPLMLLAVLGLWWTVREPWMTAGMERGPDYPNRNPQTTDIDAEPHAG
jgi:hypothetical protein